MKKKSQRILVRVALVGGITLVIASLAASYYSTNNWEHPKEIEGLPPRRPYPGSSTPDLQKINPWILLSGCIISTAAILLYLKKK